MYKLTKILNLTSEEKQKSLDELKNVCKQCKNCALHSARLNVVFADGSCDAKIMLIGEAPGADEDASGLPFVGRAGKYLNELLESAGLKRAEDLYICNTVKCRPPQNRVPSGLEKSACSAFLASQISIINPKIIILCGACAMESFLGNRNKISQVRGKWFTLFDKIKTTVIFHPSYLLRNHSEEENSPRFLTRGDLKNIKKELLS